MENSAFVVSLGQLCFAKVVGDDSRLDLRVGQVTIEPSSQVRQETSSASLGNWLQEGEKGGNLVLLEEYPCGTDVSFAIRRGGGHDHRRVVDAIKLVSCRESDGASISCIESMCPSP